MRETQPQQQNGTAANGERTDAATLARIWQQVGPEMLALLEARRNFKVTINVSAGHTAKVEIVKFLDI